MADGTVRFEITADDTDFRTKLSGLGKTAESAVSKAGSGLSAIGDKLSAAGGVAQAVVGGVSAAVIGLAAKGGIDRALNIEQAKAKLEGLGHDSASVTEIMNDALASVKGTAYGLGDAASVAASMSASGVQEGEQMTSVLKTIASTAAVSGRSFQDIGTIFSSVAAVGHLQGQDMLQLMQSGIPVLQLLANHLGTTTDKVSDMVSKGKIDFQTFSDAMQEGMGDAAQKAGDTFTGALANVKAALSRLGEAAATPALAALKDVFKALIPMIDNVTSALKPLISSLVDKLSPVVEGIVGHIKSFGDSLSGLSSGFGDMTPAVSVVAAAFAAWASGGLGSLLSGIPLLGDALGPLTSVLGGIGGPIGIVIAAFAALSMTVPEVRDAFSGIAKLLADGFSQGSAGADLQGLATSFNELLKTIGDVVDAIYQSAKPAFEAIGEFVGAVFAGAIDTAKSVLDSLRGALENSEPALSTIGGVFSDLAQGALPTFKDALKLIGDLISGGLAIAFRALSDTVKLIADGLEKAEPYLQAFQQAAGNAISGVSGSLSGLSTNTAFAAVDTAFKGIGDAVSNVFGGMQQVFQSSDMQQVLQHLQDSVSYFTSQLKPFYDTVLVPLGNFLVNTVAPVLGQVIGTVIGSLIDILASVINILGSIMQAVTSVVQFFQNAPGAIQNTWNAFVTWFQAIPGNIVNFFSGIGQGIASFFSDAASNAQSFFQPAVDWFNGIPGQIVGFFSGIGSGIGDAFSAAHDTACSFGQGIMDFFQGIPGRIMDWFSNLHISIPTPRIPHIEVSWEHVGVGDVGIDIPHPYISWNALGALFTGPTVLAQGFGEAGNEYALPLNDRTLRPLASGIVDMIGRLGGMTSQTGTTVYQTFSQRFDAGSQDPYVLAAISNRNALSLAGVM